MAPSNRDGSLTRPPRRRANLQPSTVRTNFYRDELAKHRRCLEQQREYYSQKAIDDVEAALTRLMSQVDHLCKRENGDQLVSRLLRKIDGVTRLSAWTDDKKSH